MQTFATEGSEAGFRPDPDQNATHYVFRPVYATFAFCWRLTLTAGRRRGRNYGFSTFFSTVVENFGGRPYENRRGTATVAQAQTPDNRVSGGPFV